MDFPDQHFETFIRLAKVRFGLTLFPFQLVPQKRLPKPAIQQIEEALSNGLNHEVGCAGMNRLDSDSRIAIPSHEYDWWMPILRDNFVEHLAAALFRHMIVDGDQIEGRGPHELQTFICSLGGFDIEATLFQRALDQPPQAGVIIDIQDLLGFY